MRRRGLSTFKGGVICESGLQGAGRFRMSKLYVVEIQCGVIECATVIELKYLSLS